MNIEISGTYPIVIGGESCGELSVSREGLFWHFDAECEMRGEMVRLSVYGQDAEGYLGLLTPENGKLHLHKKFSRSALAGFPKTIEYASIAGQPLPSRETEPETEYPDQALTEKPASPEESAESECESESPAKPLAISPPERKISTASAHISPLEEVHHAEYESTSPPEREIPAENASDSPSEDKNGEQFCDGDPPRVDSSLESADIPPLDREIKALSTSESPLSQKNSAFNKSHSPLVHNASPVTWRSCPLPCSLFTDVEAKSASGGIRGALSCRGDGFTRLAVPLSEAHAIGRRSILRFDESAEIDGTTYVVCKIKNGRPM